eukprot:TRINITY_DN113664_c0_g1_i1.p1 TRINITY_DN113664_c0_g1~~TRINITY_DN113664_c0_g1_i1.p1  ORF type:complete len:350 (+),score=47.64 TRINITY_DN113664_c0_g1_i1:129-1178(+)
MKSDIPAFSELISLLFSWKSKVLLLQLVVGDVASTTTTAAAHDHDLIVQSTDPDSPSLSEDDQWKGSGRARLLSFELGSKSALVIDGRNDWHARSLLIHREEMSTAENIFAMRADSEKSTNAYAFPHKDKQPGILGRLTRDSAVQDAFLRVFGVDARRCAHGRSSMQEVFLIVQNFSMQPDEWHTDICEGLDEEHQGITVLTYPSDQWDLSWEGHFEFGNGAPNAVARLAPLENRSIIFDGCLQHRATNPTSTSAPLRSATRVSRTFSEEIGVGERAHWWHLSPSFDFRGWRFAVSMQLICPKIDVRSVNSDVVRDRDSGGSGGSRDAAGGDGRNSGSARHVQDAQREL